MIHADTSFLVDLLRDTARSIRGPATVLLEEIAGEEIRVGVHVVCELLAGAEGARRPAVERQRVRRLCGSLVVSYPDERFASVYARLLASLRPAEPRRRSRSSSWGSLRMTPWFAADLTAVRGGQPPVFIDTIGRIPPLCLIFKSEPVTYQPVHARADASAEGAVNDGGPS